MSKGSQIAALRFNNIRTKTINILGLGANEKGYGQAITSAPVLAGQVVSSSLFNNLRIDLSKCYTHQTNQNVANVAPNISKIPPNLKLIGAGEQITDDIFVQYENFANYIEANKDTVNPAQLTSTTITSSSKAPNTWGSTVDSISYEVTLTFNGYTSGALSVNGENHIRAFFNAGGYIEITGDITGLPAGYENNLSYKKDKDWKSILVDLQFRASNSTVSEITSTTAGSTVNSQIGFRDLIALPLNQVVTLLDQRGIEGVYSENFYKIEVWMPSTSQLRFRMTFNDADQGDLQQAPGPAVDENIKGTLQSNVIVHRPFGDYVDITAPTGTATTL